MYFNMHKVEWSRQAEKLNVCTWYVVEWKRDKLVSHEIVSATF